MYSFERYVNARPAQALALGPKKKSKGISVSLYDDIKSALEGVNNIFHF